MRHLLITLLITLLAFPVLAATVGQRGGAFSAAVAPQAKMDVPRILIFDQNLTATHPFRVYHVAKPTGTSPVSVLVRLAEEFNGEIDCRGTSSSGAIFRNVHLSRAWAEIVRNQEDVSEFSGSLSCTMSAASSQLEALVEWKYEISALGVASH